MEHLSTIKQELSFDQKQAQATLFKSVYVWMTMALALTGLTSYFVLNSPSLLQTIAGNPILFYGMLIAEIALVFFLSARIQHLSFSTATLVFIVYSVLNGATLALLLLLYTGESIVSTFFITAGTFAVMAFIGTTTKTDLSSMGKILLMALIGIIIATVVNIFLKNSMLHMVISYVGVLIFVGLTAYDSQQIKRMIQEYGHEVNESTQKIALMGALKLYLDFINLFIFLLRILGSRR